jgi:uracil permease
MQITQTKQLSSGAKVILGIQHLFAMFGSTVLVPALTGLNPSVALICAGIGTLIFHFCTGHKVPVFVGSSFAYLAALQVVIKEQGIPAAQGGIIVAGAVYLVLALLVKLVGVHRVKSFFPPVVTGPVIVVIGLTLAPTGIDMAASNWWVSAFVLVVIVAVSIFAKGFFRLVPILIGLASGYILSIILSLTGVFPDLVDFAPIADASWISPFWDIGNFFTLPEFNGKAIALLGPIAFVTFMEHIGDITTNGSVVGKDFFEDPGLHKTLLGDGLATMAAGLLGGPANTTYSENTGVLAVTRVYDTVVLKIAAVFAIALGLLGKVGAVILCIPDAVKGGMAVVLFGMIAAVGMRTITEAQLDFTHSRNLLITALILVFGLGLSSGIQIGDVTITGLFLAVLVGVVANKLLPQDS